MTEGVVKAVSKPVVIEAFLWAGGPAAATPIINWILENDGTARWEEECEKPLYDNIREGLVVQVGVEVVTEGIYIRTLEGTMKADPGDWILRGTRGEFYPCKPDVFATKYEVLGG